MPAAAFGDETSYRRVVGRRLQQLDERVAGREAGDPRSVGVGERNLAQAQDVAVERNALVQTAHRDADVRDDRAAARLRAVGSLLHVIKLQSAG